MGLPGTHRRMAHQGSQKSQPHGLRSRCRGGRRLRPGHQSWPVKTHCASLDGRVVPTQHRRRRRPSPQYLWSSPSCRVSGMYVLREGSEQGGRAVRRKKPTFVDVLHGETFMARPAEATLRTSKCQSSMAKEYTDRPLNHEATIHGLTFDAALPLARSGADDTWPWVEYTVKTLIWQ